MENLLNNLYRLKSLLLIMFSIFILAGCGGGSSSSSPGSSNEVRTLENDLVSITISSTNLTAVYPGSIVQFNATAYYRDGKTEDVTAKVNWSSSNTDIATINNDGSAIAGTALGTTDIRAAKDGVKSNILALNVVAPAATVVSLLISPEAARIAKDTTQQYKATAVYSDGTLINVTSDSHTTWISSDTSIATISNDQADDGLATGVMPGVDVITAKYTDNQGHTVTSEKSNVTVTDALITSIVVTPYGLSLPLGSNQQYIATATFTDSTRQDVTDKVTWTSSNENTAMITPSGFAKSVGTGTTTITATSSNGVSGNVSGSTPLQITNKVVTSIQVTPANQSIALGTTQQYTAMVTYSDGSTVPLTSSVTWTTKDGSIATINDDGLATGSGVGSTDIIATFGGVSGSTGLTVTAKVLNKIKVTPSTTTIAAGLQQQYKATGYYSDGSNDDITASVTWLSSNTDVATITNSVTPGLATTLAPGSTTISASQDGISSDTSNTSASLTVTDVVLTSIAVSTNTPSIPAGTTAQYTAIGTYSNGSTSDITALVAWDSDNKDVATISFVSEQNAAVANGLSQGTANISASMSGVTGTSVLTVTAAKLTQIVVSPSRADVPIGGTQIYTAEGYYSDNTHYDITDKATWYSDDTTIATVAFDPLSGEEVATGKSVGNVTIEADMDGLDGTAGLTVNAAVLQSITVSADSQSLPEGVSQQYTATGHYDSGLDLDITSSVTWTSDNASIADISSTGMATAGNQTGTVTITATQGSVSGNASLTVTDAVIKSLKVITAGSTVESIPVGVSQRLQAIGIYSNGESVNLTNDPNTSWVSQPKRLASVTNDYKYQQLGKGIVTGLVDDPETPATIKATYNDVKGADSKSFSASTNLYINSAHLLSISISAPHKYIIEGESMQFQVYGTYDDGVTYSLDGNQAISWSSSNSVIDIKKRVGLATAAPETAGQVSTIKVDYTNLDGGVQSAQESISVLTLGKSWTSVDTDFKTDVTISQGILQPSFDLAVGSDDNPILVYANAEVDDMASVAKYHDDGSSAWELLGGNVMSDGAVSYPNISVYQGASGDSVYVFYIDNSLSGNNQNHITGKKLDGDQWSLVQSNIHGSQSNQPDAGLTLALDKDGTPFIGFHENNSGSTASPNNEVYNYSGSSFTQLGDVAYKGDNSHSLSLAISNSGTNGTYLAYVDKSFEPALSYHNGSKNWSEVNLSSTTSGNKGEFTSIVTNPLFSGSVYATFQENSGASGSGQSNIVFESLVGTTKALLEKFSVNTTQFTTYNDLAISQDSSAIPVLSYIDEDFQVAVLYWDASAKVLKPVGQNPITQNFTTTYTRPKVAVGKNKIWVAFADSGGVIHLEKIDRSSGFKK